MRAGGGAASAFPPTEGAPSGGFALACPRVGRGPRALPPPGGQRAAAGGVRAARALSPPRNAWVGAAWLLLHEYLTSPSHLLPWAAWSRLGYGCLPLFLKILCAFWLPPGSRLRQTSSAPCSGRNLWTDIWSSSPDILLVKTPVTAIASAKVLPRSAQKWL